MSKPLKCVWQGKRLSETALLNLVEEFKEEDGTALLYSGGTSDMAHRCYLYLFPYQKLIVEPDFYVSQRQPGHPFRMPADSNAWDWLQSQIDVDDETSASSPRWVGYLGFEMHHNAGPAPHPIPKPPNYPLAYFQRSVLNLVWTRATQSACLYLDEEGFNLLSTEKQRIVKNLLKFEYWSQKRAKPLSASRWEMLEGPLDRQTYYSMIEQAKEHIRAGDIYQVCLSQRLTFRGNGSPYSLFLQLVQENPTAYAAFLKAEQLSVVSSSPERFLEKNGSKLETRPIKGTAPRGKTIREDLESQKALLNSEKERAELLMITDLMRNDLGRVSQTGTVETKELCKCESFSNVFHLHSRIESIVLPNLHPIEILRACFPPGSISGCPKIRAVEIISSLEQRPRGIYTGALGHVFSNGDFDFSVAIRTLTFLDGIAAVQLGGAVTLDSDPEKEYDETMHKGSSILSALKSNKQDINRNTYTITNK